MPADIHPWVAFSMLCHFLKVVSIGCLVHHDKLTRYQESSPPVVHNHIKKDIFYVCTCFSDDMMAVRWVTVRVRYEMVETDREGRTSTHETGRWLSADGAGAFSGALLRPALVHRYVSTQQQQTRHTRHTAFLPHSAGLYTHNTTPKQVPCRASVKNKFENIFRQYFSWYQYCFATILESIAWCSRRSCLVHIFTYIMIADSGCGPVAGVGAGSVPGVAREKVQRWVLIT